ANITEFGVTPLFSVDELARAGVGIVLYPLSAFRAMNAAALAVYEAVRRDGSQKRVVSTMQTRAELYDFLDYHAYEKKLDELCARDKEKCLRAEDPDRDPGAVVPARGLPLAGPRDERRARATLSRAVRIARGARGGYQEDEDEVASLVSVGARHRRGSVHSRHLRGPDRAQPPLLEHGLAREEGRRRDLRGLAPGFVLWLRRPSGAGRPGALRVREPAGLSARHPGLAQVGHPAPRGDGRPEEHPGARAVHHRAVRRIEGRRLRASSGGDGDVRQLARARLGGQLRTRPAVPLAGGDAADLGEAGEGAPARHAHARRRHVRQLRRRATAPRRVGRDPARQLGPGRGPAPPPALPRHPLPPPPPPPP